MSLKGVEVSFEGKFLHVKCDWRVCKSNVKLMCSSSPKHVIDEFYNYVLRITRNGFVLMNLEECNSIMVAIGSRVYK